jgi:hypothetical protein
MLKGHGVWGDEQARMVLSLAPRPARRLRLIVGLREEDPA